MFYGNDYIMCILSDIQVPSENSTHNVHAARYSSAKWKFNSIPPMWCKNQVKSTNWCTDVVDKCHDVPSNTFTSCRHYTTSQVPVPNEQDIKLVQSSLHRRNHGSISDEYSWLRGDPCVLMPMECVNPRFKARTHYQHSKLDLLPTPSAN